MVLQRDRTCFETSRATETDVYSLHDQRRRDRLMTTAASSSMRRAFSVALLCAALVPVAGVFAVVEAQTQLVFVLRHCEKSTEPADDPVLSEAGAVRAAELARILGRSGVTALYATKTARSRQTLEPLAHETGLFIEELEADDPYGVAQRILDDASPVAVTAGHGDTIGPILERLGVTEFPFESVRWDDLFLVVRAPGAPACLHWLKVGPPVEE